MFGITGDLARNMTRAKSQLCRVDHFLGKMSLEEVLYLRFADAVLEPVGNRDFVECVAGHCG